MLVGSSEIVNLYYSTYYLSKSLKIITVKLTSLFSYNNF